MRIYAISTGSNMFSVTFKGCAICVFLMHRYRVHNMFSLIENMIFISCERLLLPCPCAISDGSSTRGVLKFYLKFVMMLWKKKKKNNRLFKRFFFYETTIRNSSFTTHSENINRLHCRIDCPLITIGLSHCLKSREN